MNILKVILFIIVLLTIEVIIHVGVYVLIEGYIESDSLVHFFGLMKIIPLVMAYLITFKLFKVKFDWKNGQNKLKVIELNIIVYILILTIGLELFDRPFFDFGNIVNFIKDRTFEPYVKTERVNVSLVYEGISVLIVAPIFEELVFRRYMYTELLKKYTSKMSILVSSVLFSLFHLPSYRNLIPTFIFGIICCIIYKKTRNICYTIILHFFVNLSWLVLVFFWTSFHEWSCGLEYNFMYWGLFIIGVVLTFFSIKKIVSINKNALM